jgi:hypothetical protein
VNELEVVDVVVCVEKTLELVRVVVVDGTVEELVVTTEVVVLDELDGTREVVVVDELLGTWEVVDELDGTTVVVVDELGTWEVVEDDATVVELEETEGDVVWTVVEDSTVVVDESAELLELSVGVVVVVWLLESEELTVLELATVEEELLGMLSVPFLMYMLNRSPAPQNWKSEPSHLILHSLSATRL